MGGVALNFRRNIHREVLDTSRFVGGNDSRLSSPIGGCFQLFHYQWDHSIANRRFIALWPKGCPWNSTPHTPTCFVCCHMPHQEAERLLMENEVRHFFDINAIKQVPLFQEGTRFYSRLSLVPKSSGGYRGIPNLKYLNWFILYRRFKMQSLRSILACVRQGYLLQSVDLKTYLHVPIHPLHRQYLRFNFNGRQFQYCSIPFGFSSAPW